MPQVIHFEISADDVDRVSKFYQDVFGWTITKWDGPEEYWVIQTGEGDYTGIDGGIMKRSDPTTSTVNTIEVKDIDEYCQKVVDNGGEVVAAKIVIDGVGQLAYCKDTEGNKFGVIEPIDHFFEEETEEGPEEAETTPST